MFDLSGNSAGALALLLIVGFVCLQSIAALNRGGSHRSGGSLCRHCGATVSADDRRCVHCGANLEE